MHLDEASSRVDYLILTMYCRKRQTTRYSWASEPRVRSDNTPSPHLLPVAVFFRSQNIRICFYLDIESRNPPTLALT